MDAIDARIGERDPRRWRLAQPTEDSAERRMVVWPGARQRFNRIRQQGRLGARQRGVAGIVVLRIVMVHAAHDGQPMRLPRGQWQVLADTVAGNAGGDWLKLAANLGRRLRLHVKGVVMRRAALLKEDYTR